MSGELATMADFNKKVSDSVKAPIGNLIPDEYHIPSM